MAYLPQLLYQCVTPIPNYYYYYNYCYYYYYHHHHYHNHHHLYAGFLLLHTETNHIFRVYSLAAVLYLQFVVHVMLFPMLNVSYFNISTFRSMCAVPNMAVFFLFVFPRLRSFPECCAGLFLNVFEMVPVAHSITGVTFFYSTCAALLLIGLYILEFSQLLS